MGGAITPWVGHYEMHMNVATVVANNERRVIERFESAEIIHYAPKVLIKHRVGGGVVRERKTFLFPGYIFVKADGEKFREVVLTPGISGVLLSCGEPAKVSQSVIDNIKSKEQDGFINVDLEQRRRFRKGQMVRVKSGSFLGLNGIIANIIGQDNVRVLFNLFGRKTPAIIPESELSVA